MNYLNDICKDCPKRTEDCHATCGEYARELKKHKFLQRWEYDHSLADRYKSTCTSKANAYKAKKAQRRQLYRNRNGK